jgi:hypothetical protein
MEITMMPLAGAMRPGVRFHQLREQLQSSTERRAVMVADVVQRRVVLLGILMPVVGVCVLGLCVS